MLRRVLALVPLLLALSITRLAAQEPRAWVDERLTERFDLYRDFHAHPELSFQDAWARSIRSDSPASSAWGSRALRSTPPSIIQTQRPRWPQA